MAASVARSRCNLARAVFVTLALCLSSFGGHCTSELSVPIVTNAEALSSQISSAFNALMEALQSKREVAELPASDGEASSVPAAVTPPSGLVIDPKLPHPPSEASLAPTANPRPASVVSDGALLPSSVADTSNGDLTVVGYGSGGDHDYDYYPQVRGAPIITPVMDKVCAKRGCKLLSEFDDLSFEGRRGVESARAAGLSINSKLQAAHDKVLGDFATPGPTRQKVNDRVYQIENRVARHWDKSLPHDGAVMSVVDGPGGATIFGKHSDDGDHDDDGHH